MAGICIIDYKVPDPLGYALGVRDFIVHNAPPTTQLASSPGSSQFFNDACRKMGESPVFNFM